MTHAHMWKSDNQRSWCCCKTEKKIKDYSINGAGKTVYPYGKVKMDLYLLSSTKTKSSWNKDLNARGKIIKLLYRNMKEGTYTLGGIEGF